MFVLPLLLSASLIWAGEGDKKEPSLLNQGPEESWSSLTKEFDQGAHPNAFKFTPVVQSKPFRIEDEFRFEYGSEPNTQSSARVMGSLFRGVGHLEDYAIEEMIPDEDSWLRIGARVIFVFPNALAAFITNAIQHEYFGHAGAARRFDLPSEVHIDANPFTDPDQTLITDVPGYKRLNTNERLSIVTGGLEATAVAADVLKRDMMNQDYIYWAYWPIWFYNKIESTLYPLLTSEPGSSRYDRQLKEGNDIAAMTELFSEKSGRSRSSIYRAAKYAGIFNATDPMMVPAFWDYGVRYMGQGEKYSEVPGVKIGPYQGMIATRGWVSPAGPEADIQFYLRDPEKKWVAEATYRQGFDGAWGVGAGINNLKVSDELTFRMGLEYWRQQIEETPGGKSHGFGGTVGVDWEATKYGGPTLDLGYKTEGAWLGRSWDPGLFVTVGWNLKLRSNRD